MERQLQQIREQQRESWNKFSPGWRKWDDMFMDFLKPMGDEMTRLLRPHGNDVILDIAAGTGEPGLTIASKLNGGKVVITDLSEDMLSIAKENARRRGIRNIETLPCDASELPYGNNTFDAVSCRLGFMFFPDVMMAAKEMVRVLKPGGRIATSVWNIPDKNFWITAILGTINRNMEISEPPSGAPGMFRCSKEGLISGLFQQVGLKNISVTEVGGKLNCKTTDVYWSLMTELSAPVVAALAKANDMAKRKIRRDVYTLVNKMYPPGLVTIDGSALIIYGEK